MVHIEAVVSTLFFSLMLQVSAITYQRNDQGQFNGQYALWNVPPGYGSVSLWIRVETTNCAGTVTLTRGPNNPVVYAEYSGLGLIWDAGFGLPSGQYIIYLTSTCGATFSVKLRSWSCTCWNGWQRSGVCTNFGETHPLTFPFEGFTGVVCQGCPAGFYCNGGSTAFACPPGSFCPGGTSTTNIQPCPAGKYCLGMTNSSAGDGKCARGRFCSGGNINANGTGPCASGYFCDFGSIDQFGNNGTGVNNLCPEGSFCPEGIEWPLECPLDAFCPQGTVFPHVYPGTTGTVVLSGPDDLCPPKGPGSLHICSLETNGIFLNSINLLDKLAEVDLAVGETTRMRSIVEEMASRLQNMTTELEALRQR